MVDLLKKYKNIEVSGFPVRNNYCIVDSRVHGLFACFYCILYGLHICEKEELIPVIFLGEKHLYYQKEIGDNIFNYFYEQNECSSQITGKITVINPTPFLRWCHISSVEKRCAEIFISKYFTLKSEIKKRIEVYTGRFNFQRILGVHYRGRDKITETNILSFDYYFEKINFILENKLCDLIFFSTDELELRDLIKIKYKEKVILYSLEGGYTDINNDSKNGLHFQTATPYLHGKDALIECYLLASCSMLLSSCTSSMSLFSTFINPQLIHIPLEP